MFFKYILKCKSVRPLALIKFRTSMFKLAFNIGLFPNVKCNGDVRVIQSLNIRGQGEIILGRNCSLGFYPSPNMYRGECYLEARYPNSKLIIGDRVFINNNAVVIADKSIIVIGDDTLIGPNFLCIGSNFHPLNPVKRLTDEYQCKPIYIGKNVFIGANVTILQGVTIGDNSVIAAGTTIHSNIPANTVVKLDSMNIKLSNLRCD